MKRETKNDSRLKNRAIVLLAAAAAFTALVFTSPVQAGGHGHRKPNAHQKHHQRYKPYKQFKHYDYGHVRVHSGRRVMPAAFVAPARINARFRAEFRPYLVREIWVGAHRHHHEIYVFPIRTRHGIVYREYDYCRGDLFFPHRENHGQIVYNGRNVSFSIGF